MFRLYVAVCSQACEVFGLYFVFSLLYLPCVFIFSREMQWPNIAHVSFADPPFEFRALEVALEAICSFLDARTTELETAAYPALDELTKKV